MNVNVYDYKSGDKLAQVKMTQNAWTQYVRAAQQPEGLIRADHVLTPEIRDALAVKPGQTIFLQQTNRNPSERMTLKKLLEASKQMSDEYEYFADAERTGEISRTMYFRASQVAGLSHDQASEVLRENYQRASLGHLYP